MAGSELAPVAGVRLGVASAGIKTPGRADLVIMELAAGSSIAAVFTRNAFCAAPVQVAREHWRRGGVRYLLINTGNANAGTGKRGIDDALESCRELARRRGVDAAVVMPFSTGVIGEFLPMERLLAGVGPALEDLAETRWSQAAQAILTTDTRPKGATRRLEIAGTPVTLTGIAKGSGMIRPNMATMLAFLATDAAIAPTALQSLWQEAVDRSFNRITVDGDTSTNDAAVLVATAVAGHALVEDPAAAELAGFREALLSLSLELAQEIVRDGEGATKFVTIRVSGARGEDEALEAAYTVAQSPLVKTALFASDPNWGRLLAALGRAGLEDLDVERVELRINGTLIASGGARDPGYSENAGQAAMASPDITIDFALNRGSAAAAVWTSDLSYDYVRINAEYRT
jgi:glutamate N-acetyltransferase/amino-acid N-acetyltransferase